MTNKIRDRVRNRRSDEDRLPPGRSTGPLLKVSNLTVSYGEIRALKEITVEVGKGEFVVLLGANGAGKTTLLETILGIHKPDAGSVVFQGQPITGRSADKNVRNGICLVPEGRGIFAGLSVYDNLMLGAYHNPHEAGQRLEEMYRLFPFLSARKAQTAGTLSGGERQTLAIARALMAAPTLIMIDEPSLGLAPKAVENIFDVLDSLHKQGYSILFAEQNANIGLHRAERGYVLDVGRTTAAGKSEELLSDGDIREAYLGR